MSDKVSEEEKKAIIDRLHEILTKMNASFVAKDTGASATEYAMLVVFITCVCILGYELLGGSVKGLFVMANALLPF
jgi:Flp pilus assembly pilin Flp